GGTPTTSNPGKGGEYRGAMLARQAKERPFFPLLRITMPNFVILVIFDGKWVFSRNIQSILIKSSDV
ncbi:MAG: hypothetical protein QGF71_00075, partial [Rhodospirillales bacterium]|nr:hypothetical protein [Rhodospirillales bacterium]